MKKKYKIMLLLFLIGIVLFLIPIGSYEVKYLDTNCIDKEGSVINELTCTKQVVEMEFIFSLRIVFAIFFAFIFPIFIFAFYDYDWEEVNEYGKF